MCRHCSWTCRCSARRVLGAGRPHEAGQRVQVGALPGGGCPYVRVRGAAGSAASVRSAGSAVDRLDRLRALREAAGGQLGVAALVAPERAVRANSAHPRRVSSWSRPSLVLHNRARLEVIPPRSAHSRGAEELDVNPNP
eukprot:13115773-Heterocapsa_arctica.AAC.1